MGKKIDQKVVLDANIRVHSALANSGEYNRSPHFLPENQRKIRQILESICSEHFDSTPSGKLLDMGCGTGFIINLAHDLFETVHGLDITDDMMAQVDLSPGNIELFKSAAEQTPFESESYRMVTAYSFLDHLVSYEPVLLEAYRLLEPGGVFYSDLNPNRHFSNRMMNIESNVQHDLPEVVTREIRGMLHNGEFYQETFGIDSQTLENAEPIKSYEHGIDPLEFISTARKVGFQTAEFIPDWFLGQAIVTHGQSESHAETIDDYLRSILPASLDLFKYLRFLLVK
ncbi:MAG: class I SAM-dependent methyltransferase [Xanthomonadales bacterium]|nr:class I SAM-dependent methyltransferase [Desulfofustis sp.]NNL04406.1 class I SAM-dependent methyltransferase [Xanthomonadales bacterium]